LDETICWGYLPKSVLKDDYKKKFQAIYIFKWWLLEISRKNIKNNILRKSWLEKCFVFGIHDAEKILLKKATWQFSSWKIPKGKLKYTLL
jgi:hypothetical protein